jgi:hypothetical protein
MAHPRTTRIDTIFAVLIDLLWAALIAAILIAG